MQFSPRSPLSVTAAATAYVRPTQKMSNSLPPLQNRRRRYGQTQTDLMGSKCHRRLARQALAHIFIHVRKVPQKFGRRRRSRSRSCSSPTANSQTDRRRTGVIFSGRPPFLLLFFSPCFACVSIELSISRPCRGHSRPDPNKRDRNLIGPNSAKKRVSPRARRSFSADAFGLPIPFTRECAPLQFGSGVRTIA